MSEATFSEKISFLEDIAELTELMCLERSEVSESGTGLLELIAEQEQILEDLGIESKSFYVLSIQECMRTLVSPILRISRFYSRYIDYHYY